MENESFGREPQAEFRGPRRFPPKPVKMDEEYEVDIKEMSQRGDGIARIEGLVVFVPNGKVGDHLRLKIMRISRKFAEAEVIEKGEHPKEASLLVKSFAERILDLLPEYRPIEKYRVTTNKLRA